MTRDDTPRWEIYSLLVDYADALDKRQLDRVGECFATDASARYSGIEVGPGRDAIVAFLDEHLTSLASTHFVGNVQIDLESESEAHTDTFVLATHVVQEEGETVLQQRGLRYLDDVVRGDDGRWRISRREHIPVWAGRVAGGLL